MRVERWAIVALLVGACSSGATTTAPASSGPTVSEPVASTGAAPPTATITTSTSGPLPLLAAWTCPTDLRGRGLRATECHRLEVPADWSDPDGATISLPIAVLPASSGRPEPDPIVIPAGGPGYDGLGSASYWRDSPLAMDRDIVLYDQRGTGRADPTLECPESDAALVSVLQRDAPFEEERQAVVDALRACRARLEGEGVDLDDYDTEASVRDLDAIRQALGYESWNLLGISYGARLSLAAMRSTPAHLRSVILDSVYDVAAGGFGASTRNAERAFQQLADGCAADPGCARAHGDVGATITAVRDRYNAIPITVDVDLDDGKGPQTFVITGDDAMGGLFNALYDADLIPLLPSILDGLAAGDTGVVPELLRRGVRFSSGQADAMQMSVDCADNAGLEGEPAGGVLPEPGRTRLLVTNALCSEWPVEPTSPTFNQAVSSSLPTLVLAGLYDPVTPPAGSEAVAGRLTNATFGLWPNQGHAVTGEPCATTIELAFLAAPTAPVDLGCLASIRGPAFA